MGKSEIPISSKNPTIFDNSFRFSSESVRIDEFRVLQGTITYGNSMGFGRSGNSLFPFSEKFPGKIPNSQNGD